MNDSFYILECVSVVKRNSGATLRQIWLCYKIKQNDYSDVPNKRAARLSILGKKSTNSRLLGTT